MAERFLNSSDGNLVVDGVDMHATYGFVVVDDPDLGEPEVKTNYVDIPGRDGPLDLSEALTGHPTYGQREMTIQLARSGCDRREWNRTLSRLRSLLHGRRHGFSLAVDPGYTYHGRFSVGESSHVHVNGGIGTVTLTVTADPYKRRGTSSVTFDAVGGVMLACASGTRPVHPLVTCAVPVTVEWEGTRTVVPSGTWRLNDVLLTEGDNELWFSVHNYSPALWEDVAGRTWESMRGTRWEGVVVEDGEASREGSAVRATWDTWSGTTWDAMKDRSWAHAGVTDVAFEGDGTVTVSWEVEDL